MGDMTMKKGAANPVRVVNQLIVACVMCLCHLIAEYRVFVSAAIDFYSNSARAAGKFGIRERRVSLARSNDERCDAQNKRANEKPGTEGVAVAFYKMAICIDEKRRES